MNIATASQWLWAVLAGYWIYSGKRTKATTMPESSLARLAHVMPVVAGFVLIVEGGFLPPPLSDTIFAKGLVQELSGSFLTAAGIGFAIWARATL
jgi:hypothetical protein